MKNISRIIDDYRNAFRIFGEYRCKSDFPFGGCKKHGFKSPDYLLSNSSL